MTAYRVSWKPEGQQRLFGTLIPEFPLDQLLLAATEGPLKVPVWHCGHLILVLLSVISHSKTLRRLVCHSSTRSEP
jgi:hypothetical protein